MLFSWLTVAIIAQAIIGSAAVFDKLLLRRVWREQPETLLCDQSATKLRPSCDLRPICDQVTLRPRSIRMGPKPRYNEQLRTSTTNVVEQTYTLGELSSTRNPTLGGTFCIPTETQLAPRRITTLWLAPPSFS